MSWSFTKSDVPKEDVASVIDAAHKETYAYQNHEPHKRVMDALTDAATKIAEVAPDGSTVGIESYGHFNDDGSGSVTLKVAQAVKPEVPPSAPTS